ncbi:hypothetical protein [Argonema antarcticum]|nr:hypothetical protein [Argonema antarcticum]
MRECRETRFLQETGFLRVYFMQLKPAVVRDRDLKKRSHFFSK